MQIPIISGIYTDGGPDVRRALPRNLVPVGQSSGVSEGYLRPADGLTEAFIGPGVDRGGVPWFNGGMVRVIGTSLYVFGNDPSASAPFLVGSVATFANTLGRCTFAQGFERLGVTAGGSLWYVAPGIGPGVYALNRVSALDSVLPTVISVEWLDGRFIVTDGELIYAMEVSDPNVLNPFSYGSSEIDPDPVVRLLVHRKELHVINRHSIEVFQTVGGTGFPLARVPNAVTEKGAVGTHAACVFDETIAFVGGARNEALGVYLADNSIATKISDGEIDRLLAGLTEQQAADIVVEARAGDDQKHLYVHLPTQTLVFDSVETKRQQRPVWFTLDSGQDTRQRYRAAGWVHAFGKWWAGDPTQPGLAYADKTQGAHYGAPVQHEFSTIMLYADSQDAIVHEMELIALPGRVALGANPTVWTSYSRDGLQYSQERGIAAGSIGQTLKRLAWRTMGRILHWRIQRFRWLSDAHISVMALNVEIEPLFVRPRRA